MREDDRWGARMTGWDDWMTGWGARMTGWGVGDDGRRYG